MKLKSLIIAIGLFVPIGFMVASQPVLAAAKCPTTGSGTTASDAISAGIDCAAGGSTTKPAEDFSARLGKIIDLLSRIVGVIAVIMLIVAGFQFVASGGNKDKVSGARSTIVYVVVALVVVALAQILVQFVLNNATR